MRELLRMATAGSVDDGKSTLIGRLLLDTGSLPTDHLAAVDGPDGPDLAALSDGLRAEREQGITIDVAYRFFSTAARNYVLADTPGHVRYTRNMVTGASNAHLAMLLVDVRAGVLDQTRRHARIATLLGVPHLVAAVNKMDLVDFDRGAFDRVRTELQDVAERLGVPLLVVPVAAKHGDNVAVRSARTPWWDGPTLLEHLDAVDVPPPGEGGLRLPVQWVSRPVAGARRSYAGRLAAGTLRAGDEVVVLPSGAHTRVTALDALDEERETALAPLSVSVQLADDLDVGRGDVLTAPEDPPVVTRELRAQLCWMGEEPLHPGQRLLLKHTTRTVRAEVTALHDRLDPATLADVTSPDRLELNDIGTVTVRTAVDLVVDAYTRNRDTGAFVLVDEHTHATVAAGVVREAVPRAGAGRPADGPEGTGSAPRWTPSRAARAHRGAAVWLVGAPPEALREAEAALLAAGRPAYAVDPGNVRAGLAEDLGDGPAERAELARRTGHVARLLADAGLVALVAAGSAAEARTAARPAGEAGLTAVVVTGAGGAPGVADVLAALALAEEA
ncbi:GTP-binding protein [Kineococcus terrestris]|uniref:GTP-binding protein n=1 Tax=Kineococcus terrestris TaxID=2044856 RepID=UPI0034DAC178